MASNKRFFADIIDNSFIKVTKTGRKTQVYKIPYDILKSWNQDKCESIVDNRFIVYILYTYNLDGRDIIYVGKSKNGIYGRPKQHEDKFKPEFCYILTEEKAQTFLNDGTIQYMEYQINKKINDTHAFRNTTETTNTGTANESDIIECDEYLEEVYGMLKVIGLDLDHKYESDMNGRSLRNTRQSGKPVLPDDNKMKPGQYVKKAINALLESDYLTDDMFEKLCTKEGSKAVTKRNLPLFWKVENGLSRKEYPDDAKKRYWSDVMNYKGQDFLVFSQWYVGGNGATKQSFINWYQDL